MLDSTHVFWERCQRFWSLYNTWRHARRMAGGWKRYAVCAAAVGLAALGHAALSDFQPSTSVYTLYTLAVVLGALYGSVSGGLFSTVCSVLVATGFFHEHVPGAQQAVFIGQSILITALIASLEYTAYVSQERAAQLRESNDHLRALIDGVTNYAIYLLDAKGYILSWSEAAASIQGYEDSEVLGRKFSMFYLPEQIASGKPEQDLAIAQQRGRHEEEIWASRKDGSAFWANRTITMLPNTKGQPRGFAVVTRDMTDRKQAEDQIRHQAYHDDLTGLPNRVYLQENLASLIKWAGRNQSALGVLFMDLDRFKNVNDSLGHHVGDAMLKEMAQRLSLTARTKDIVARLGGDEFVVVLNEVRSNSEAMRLAKSIADAIESEPFEVEGHRLHMQVSIGVAMYPEQGADVSSLLRNADAALYHSKRNGRQQVSMYERTMNALISEHLSMEQALRHAIEECQFEMYYQPIFSISRGATVAAEALIRWRHPEMGMVSPGEFIPLAEETGLITDLGAWVMDEVCRQQSAWIKEELTVVPVALNLSGRQFAESKLPHQIEQSLNRHRLQSKFITVEVTESIAMQDISSTVAKLDSIAKLGVSTAIDDFGIGFSSLSYLKQMPLAKVKVDKSFVDHCTGDERDAAIIKAIVSMAKSLKLKVVAEGIETPDQLRFLQGTRCDFGQGYLVSAPETAETFAKRLVAA